MGGERGRQGCNISLHVAGPVNSGSACILNPDGYVQYLELGEYLGAPEDARRRSRKPRFCSSD